MGFVALAVVGVSLASSLARRIGVVEPTVKIENGRQSFDAARASLQLRLQPVARAMDGEVAVTAERLREAEALASVASLVAVNESGGTGVTGRNLLKRLAEQDLLPPRAELTDQANALATPYGSLVLNFRSEPFGVEVLSLSKDATGGPPLMVRVERGAGGLKVWMAQTLEHVKLPRPFADDVEVIAAGWQVEKLREMTDSN
jgi:DNA-binding transcriptional regulator YdaS (Cro superfamily)